LGSGVDCVVQIGAGVQFVLAQKSELNDASAGRR